MISGLINDVRSNVSSMMNSLTNMANYYFPNFMRGLDKEIYDIMNTGLPTEIMNDLEDTVDEVGSLASRMTRSIGNMISDLVSMKFY